MLGVEYDSLFCVQAARIGVLHQGKPIIRTFAIMTGSEDWYASPEKVDMPELKRKLRKKMGGKVDIVSVKHIPDGILEL